MTPPASDANPARPEESPDSCVLRYIDGTVPSLETAMNPIRILFCASLSLVAATSALASQVILRDNFSDASTGWMNKNASRSKDLGFAVYTDSGKYQMTPVRDNTYGLVPAPRQADGDNVRIETDLFLYAGLGKGAGGVACRAKDMNNFYAFIARGDAVVAIVRVSNGKGEVLAQGTVKSVMAGSVDTRLTVECKDDQLRLSATNGSRIEATDSTLRGGTSGLLVYGEQMAGTSASFDNFVLTDLGGGTPAGGATRAAASDDARPAPAPSRPADRSGEVDFGVRGRASGRDDMPAKVRELREGELLVVVDEGNFRGEGVIAVKQNGSLGVVQQWNTGGPSGMNLYFNHSGDSFYVTLRTGPDRGSGVSSWDVQINETTGRGHCKRMDVYDARRGSLTVWSAKGERLCSAG
ncbi:hypothetical protein [Tahibacter amnicola]|uniref:Uncharacterized protein n=1 Tax=Tahibacter amnicola TaxID=2976241 RepID=A0ABY6BER8_9GAMM|nr:hypothetical protein [Tahibacter amnicola]UXI68017.1 hypothetical protein N4264_25380 [Tahibacter amnicola]